MFIIYCRPQAGVYLWVGKNYLGAGLHVSVGEDQGETQSQAERRLADQTVLEYKTLKYGQLNVATYLEFQSYETQTFVNLFPQI